jgi:peroxiredoxin
LCLDYEKFKQKNAEVIAIGPDGPNAFKHYWEQENIPFIGLADIKSKVADTYHQEVNLLKLGRMPAIFVIDLNGLIRYSHYGDSMADIPLNKDILNLLKKINNE